MTRAYHAPCRFSVVHSTPNCSGDLVVPRRRRFRLGEGRRGYHEGDQDIPNAFGERPVLKLMYAAVIRAAERWRGIAVGEFEQRQLRAIRDELGRAHAERVAPAVNPRHTAPVRKLRADR